MNRLSGVLKFIFVILILVTVGEVVYYLYFQILQPKNITPSPTNQNVPIVVSELFPTASPTYYVKDGVISSAILTDYLEGEIVELDITGGISPNSDFKYKFRLKLKKNQDVKTFYFDEEEIKRFQVIQIKNDREVPLSFADLKPGDRIQAKITFDLVKDTASNMLKFEITKM